jgi:hypothetical protein
MPNPEETQKILEENRKAEVLERLKWKKQKAQLEEQLIQAEYEKNRARNPSAYKNDPRENNKSNYNQQTSIELTGDKRKDEIIEKLNWRIQKAQLEEQLAQAEYQKNRAKNPSAYAENTIEPSKQNVKLTAFEYSQASINDLEQKKAQIMKLQFGRKEKEESNNNEYTNAMNTSVTNNNNNSTNIVTDYLRNLRVDLGRLPTWRNDLG